MKFNEHTDGWFDGLVDWATAHPAEKAILLASASKSPTKKNVIAFAKLVRKQPANFPTNLIIFGALHRHCKAVINKKFRPEYRYSFGGRASKRLQDISFVSAASSLFDSARQALFYND